MGPRLNTRRKWVNLASWMGDSRWLWVGLSVFLGGLPAHASVSGRQALEDGIAFYENLDTERALPRLEAATKATDLDPRERARAFLYLGFLRFEIGERTLADLAFREALTRDPQVAIPSGTSPKIVAAVETLRKDAVRDASPESEPAGPPTVEPAPEPPRTGKTGVGEALGPPAVNPLPPPAKQPAFENDPQPTSGGGVPWLWIGIGGAAAVTLTVVLAVALSGGQACEGAGGCVSVSFR